MLLGMIPQTHAPCKYHKVLFILCLKLQMCRCSSKQINWDFPQKHNSFEWRHAYLGFFWAATMLSATGLYSCPTAFALRATETAKYFLTSWDISIDSHSTHQNDTKGGTPIKLPSTVQPLGTPQRLFQAFSRCLSISIRTSLGHNLFGSIYSQMWTLAFFTLLRKGIRYSSVLLVVPWVFW